MGQYSKVEIDGRLMTITINRPEVYNACHPMANEELVAAFDEFHANPELWVAIITGAGDKAFCAGNDLKYHAELHAKTGKRPTIRSRALGPGQPLRPRQAGDRRDQRRRHGWRLQLRSPATSSLPDKATFALPEPRSAGRRAGGMQRLSRMIRSRGDGHDADRPPRRPRKARAGLRHRRGAARRPDEEARRWPTTSWPARRCRCAPPSRW